MIFAETVFRFQNWSWSNSSCSIGIRLEMEQRNWFFSVDMSLARAEEALGQTRRAKSK